MLPRSELVERDPLVDLLPHAVERAPQGVLVSDQSGAIITVNQKVSDILGYPRTELVGRMLHDLIPEISSGHPPRFDELAEALRNAEFTSNQRFIGVRQDGVGIPLEVHHSETTVNGATYVVTSIADLTELLNLKARLMAASSEHLGFQRLIADIVLQFAESDSANPDDLINASLRQIGEALQQDRAILWRKNDGESLFVPTHYWITPSHQSPPPSLSVAATPYIVSKVVAGESYSFSSVDDIPDPVDRDTFSRQGPMSGAVIPLSNFGAPGVLGALAFSSMTVEQEWIPAVIERLRLFAGVISQALARKTSQVSLLVALGEIDRLRARLADASIEVRRDVRPAKTSRLLLAESAVMKRALAQVEQVATTPATVLLRGETGAGKEVFAQAIHDLSPRHQRPMVVVSCAAIPTALIESELFGRERGAYTGALSRQIGRFEAANQSTLFLDEIGELSMEMQVKLLRVLQDRTIERLGSTQTIKIDVRIITATHRDLEASVREGTFREDLFYRLNVFPIVVPPLRERIEDIPGLVWSFVDEFSRAFGKTIDSLPKTVMKELESYSWPGNVRELRNVIERAVILSTGRQLVITVPRQAARVPHTAMTLEALEIDHIRKVLESTNWRVRGSGGAAARLGLKPTTLESRMARLGIARKSAAS